MTRRRVTFVLPSLHGGGAERAAVTLLNGLARTANDCTLYLFAREGPYLNQLGPHVRVVVGNRGRLGRVTSLRRFLADDPQGVVVSFLSHFSVFGAVRASGTGARYMVSQQTPVSAFLNDADYSWRHPLRRQVFTTVARTVYPRVDLIAATSQGVADDLAEHYGVGRAHLTVVHNPVDVDEVECRSAEAIEPELTSVDGMPTVVMAGRLADAKNLPLLVASFERLARHLPFRAWIIGRGELESDLRQRLADAGLTARVRLLGFQDNPWKYMARADVFVLTSRYEGFGNVLIEAMACGLPVVATSSFGTREIVEHERSGLLLERHEPDAVAAALARVLSDATLRARLADRARMRARAFSIQTVTSAFDAALAQAVNTRRAA